jgi:AraC-like DNA-binding protein
LASDDVRAAARAALASGDCTLSSAARALGTSTRTLQRRLEREGTSFGAIVEALRRELATAYLDRGLPIPEVASLLGYADTTAFHHAYRRWTGTSPSRRHARARASE